MKSRDKRQDGLDRILEQWGEALDADAKAAESAGLQGPDCMSVSALHESARTAGDLPPETMGHLLTCARCRRLYRYILTTYPEKCSLAAGESNAMFLEACRQTEAQERFVPSRLSRALSPAAIFLAQLIKRPHGGRMTKEEEGALRTLTGTTPDQSAEMEQLYADAVTVCLQEGTVTTSLLKAKLRIGYVKAAELVDMLEQRGIINSKRTAFPHTSARQGH